ncbi:MAG TPA: Ig-like domain-containing protein, partial [Candidatus Hydrogenedentes bacterium]|nr:Ig-like domain-containing protein [Candidatus Hydrogenedentota bacterium]
MKYYFVSLKAISLLNIPVFLLIFLNASIADSQSLVLNDDICVTNAPVEALLRVDDTIYIGGYFTSLGPYTGHGVLLNPSTGERITPYSKVNWYVNVCIPDGSGGWFIGGEFTDVGGQPRNRLAHILSNGLVDPAWITDADDNIMGMVLFGSTLYVSGRFTSINETPRNYIAAIDVISGTVTSWDPNANGYVFALAASSSVLYAGGNFNTIGGQTRNHIAAWDLSTGTLTAWNPSAEGDVTVLAATDTMVVAGGTFSIIGGSYRPRLAALSPTTGTALSWNPSPNNTVSTLAISGTTIYLGGAFTTISGITRNRVAAYNTSGALLSWNPNANGGVSTLAVSGSTVYAGGGFTSIGGQSRSRLAALDATSGTATAWAPNMNGGVSCLALSGSTLYVGGSFNGMDWQTRNRLAAFNANTGLLMPWDPNANSVVFALSAIGPLIYAGGHFTSVGGMGVGRLAAIDADTGMVIPLNGSTDNIVYSLAALGSTLYACGTFTTANSETRNYLAAFDGFTGDLTNWNPDPDDYVEAIAVSDSQVFAGGSFSMIGGQPRSHIAALDALSGAATEWNPTADSSVYALKIKDSTVYAGGNFSTIGGQPRTNIAALDVVTGNATPWNPTADGSVNLLEAWGSLVYAGGTFTSIGGQTRQSLAAIDADTGNVVDWNPSPSGDVRALEASEFRLNVGGWFSTIDGQSRYYLSQFQLPPIPAPPLNPDSTAIGTNTITWTWTDNSSDETSFNVYDDPGSGDPVTLQTSTAANIQAWQHNNLIPNTQYAFQVAAANVSGESEKTNPITKWTLAAQPLVPSVTNICSRSMAVTLASGDTNPAGTEYCLRVDSGMGGNVWVQTDGTLGAAPAYQTMPGWGAITVTGLTPNMMYGVFATARNGEGVDSAVGLAGYGLTLEGVPPTAALSSTAGDPVNGAITVDVTLSENSTSFEEGDITVVDAIVSDFTGSDAAYSFTLTPTLTMPGTFSCVVLAGTFSDLACNPSVEDSNILSRSYDRWPPTLTLSCVASYYVAGAIQVTAVSSEPTVTLEAGDIATTNAIISGFTPQPDGVTFLFQLVPGNQGLFSCYVPAGAFADLAENANEDDSNVIERLYDTLPPTGSVVINDDAEYTNTLAVTLTLSGEDGTGSGVADMQFSNDNIIWSEWEPYASIKALSLPAGDGPKSVYVAVRDEAGNVSSPVFSDAITFDGTPPSCVFQINGGNAATNFPEVTLT